MPFLLARKFDRRRKKQESLQGWTINNIGNNNHNATSVFINRKKGKKK